MSKIKTVVYLLVILVAMTGCNSDKYIANQEPIETVKLKVWGNKEEQALLQNMVDEFKEHYIDEAIIDIEIGINEEGEAKSNIFNDITNVADVFSFPDDQLLELASVGIIESIDIAKEVQSEYIQGSIEAATIDDKLYAYPMTADNGYFMFYNKKYLSEQDVMQLDTMLEVASKLNKKVTMDWASGWYVYAFFGNTGLTLGLKEDGITNFCNWNQSSGDISGVDIGKSMLDISRHKGFMSTGDKGLIEGAKNDEVIAGVSGVWSSHELQEIWGDDFAAVKLPTYTCKGQQIQLASFAGYKLVGVNAYSKHKKWAQRLAEWITNAKSQELRFMERGIGPSNIHIAQTDKVKNSPAIQALISQSEHASLQRIGTTYWNAVLEFTSSLLQGKINEKNLQAAMDKMVEQITMELVD